MATNGRARAELSSPWGAEAGRLPRARHFSAAASKYSDCASSSTSPAFCAGIAASCLPARMMPSAAGRPMRRGKRTEPPQAGRIPSCVSGRPIFVDLSSEATRQSQASASSQPPPRQTPLIAATDGIGSRSSRVKIRWPRSTVWPRPSRVKFLVNEFRSAPAMNILAFALISTTPRRSRRDSSVARWASNSSTVAISKRFAEEFGRSKVSRAIPASPMVREIFMAPRVRRFRARARHPGRPRCRVRRRPACRRAGAARAGPSAPAGRRKLRPGGRGRSRRH